MYLYHPRPEKYKAPTVPYMTGNIQILQKSEENQRSRNFWENRRKLDPKPFPKKSQIKIQVTLGLGWHYNHMGHHHDPTTPNF